MFTFPYVLIKHCGVVPGSVDRWHHLLLLSLYVYRLIWLTCTLSMIPSAPGFTNDSSPDIKMPNIRYWIEVDQTEWHSDETTGLSARRHRIQIFSGPGRAGVWFLYELRQTPKSFTLYYLLSVPKLEREITMKSFIFISYHCSCYLHHLHIQKSSPYMSGPSFKKRVWRILKKGIV